jgi:hypothetical protein
MRALVLSAALLVSACAYGPTVRTDFDPAANFSAYRTYNWVDTAVPQGMNPLMFARVRASIDQALAARGYTPASPGDLAISFTIGERDRLKVYDSGPYYPGWGWGHAGWGGWGSWGGWGGWGYPYPSIDVDQYTERSVVIDIYDARSRRPIWHGVGTDREYRDKVDYGKLDRAVVAALSQFPPQQATATR